MSNIKKGKGIQTDKMITYQVAFALRLFDDFSGNAILKQQFEFKIDGLLAKPILKPEGVYVFLEPLKESVMLEIRGNFYHPETVKIDKAALDPSSPLVTIRLFGKPGQGYDRNKIFLDGKITDQDLNFPVKIAALCNKETGLTYREIVRQDKATYLMCSCKEPLLEQVEGKTFCLTGKEKTDIFVIHEKKLRSEYRISDTISPDQLPGTPIQRVYCSVTDERGHYTIPIDADASDQIAAVRVL
jgi:hypothetical protein